MPHRSVRRPQRVPRERVNAVIQTIRLISRRMGVAAACVLIASTAVLVSAVVTRPTSHGLSVQRTESIHGTRVVAKARPADLSQGARKTAAGAVIWPSGRATVVLGAASTNVATDRGSRDAAGRSRAGTLPVWIGAGKGASSGWAGQSLSVSVPDRATVPAAWRNSAVVRVQGPAGAPAGPLSVAVDYSGFAGAFGGDWASRLKLVTLPDCALSTPDAPRCAPTDVVSSHNDWASRTVSAEITMSGAVTMAVTAGPSGSAGDFGATTLQASSNWSAGGNSGVFSWTYPMGTPPSLSGPAPQVTLAYSSSAVDGRNETTNNQPSWIGEGFEYWPGYIERSYKTCADDKTNGNNTQDTGDECWGTDNATLLLNGTAGELVKDDGGRGWRLKGDDNSRIERLNNTTNADNDNEYWKVTTADGNQYYFGLNRLPGYTGTAPADKTTNSVWTVPVAGNQSGEPCHQASFTASFCNQAWRWNLDYVVDRHGNTMSVFYNTESNNYGRNLSDTDVVSYVRGGTVDHIDYGTDNRSGTDTENTSTAAPMRVSFAADNRCLSSCATHDAAHWPDTPWDQSCTSSTSCPNQHQPTFWTTNRLASVTTKVWNSATGAYRDVDTWTLTHNFPDPGDGTRAGLWLETIGHTGKVGGASVSVPDINLDWVQMANRVDTSTDGKYPMNWMRVSTIWTDTGSKIDVRYTGQDCVAGSRMPSSPQNNTLRCYPVLEEQPDKTIKTEYFNKYLVSTVTVADRTGGGPDVVTSYEYVGAPAWRHADDDGMTKDNLRTWSDFRGYRQVNTRVGDPGQGSETLSESTYFQGMYGDLDGSGGTRTNSLPAIDLNGDGDTADTADAPQINDENAFSGIVRQTTVYNGVESDPVSTQVFAPWQSAPTASRNMGSTTTYARQVGTATTWEATKIKAGGWRVTRADSTFDSYGMEIQNMDYGDVAVSGDERCKKTTYTRNTGGNLLSLASQVEVYALPCGQSPSTEADVISIARTSFDHQVWGVAPTKGENTLEERAKSYAGGAVTGWLATSAASYDAYGRETDGTDVRGNHTQTAYTPTTGGPVTRITQTNPLGWTSYSDLEPAWGTTTGSVDVNGRRTDLGYDALGRLTQVWLPNHPKATYPSQPNSVYTYQVRNVGGPNAVTTKKLNANGNYITSYTLYDGLLRLRQTQQMSMAAGNVGTVFTETKYDAAGRVALTSTHFDATVQPSTTLFTIYDWQPKSETVNEYDRAGRATATIFKSSGAELWRTTTSYGGDRTSVTPPLGGTATTTIVDGLGRTTQVRQYHRPADVGSDDRTTYDLQTFHFDGKGQQDSVTDNDGNVWSYTFDLLGRQTGAVDPDKGSSTAEYNDSGDLVATTDSRKQKLAYSYDTIGRKTGEYLTSTAGTKLATWAYDPAGAKGQVASSSRWVGVDEYKVRVRGYTPTYQSTGEDYVIPASQTGLAGTYSITRSYKVDGSLATLTYPNVGNLGAETLTYTYDDATGLPEQLQTNAPGMGQYVSNTDYTAFGETSFIQYQVIGGNWLQRGFTYDDATRRLTRAQTVRQLSPQAVADVNYSYDGVGDITKIANTPAGGTADNQCFTYDYTQRLSAAWTPSSGDCTAAQSTGALGGPAPYWLSWTFDPVGDRKTQTTHASTGDTTATYHYAAAGSTQPHAVNSVDTTGPAGTKTTSYSYDSAGNTIARPGLAAVQSLTWDAEGHLAKSTEAGKDTSYIYTAEGAELIRKDPVNTTVYLPFTEIHRNNTTGAITAVRTYAWAGQDCATVATGGQLTWLVTDTQNTQEIAVTAGNQSVVQRRQTPFGTARGATVTWPTERGFVGGDNDPTGLEHIGARQYDAALGRFISVDPVFRAEAPQSWTGYSYANNSPVTQSDPTGLDSCLACSIPGFVPAWKIGVDVVGHMAGRGFNVADRGARKADSGLAYMSNNFGGVWTTAYNKETEVTTAVMGKPNDPSPVRLGWEWASGTGPKDRLLEGDKKMTQQLQQHEHVQQGREMIAEQILKGNPTYTPEYVGQPKTLSYQLNTHHLIDDMKHNETVFFLGSFDLQWKVMDINKEHMTATVRFTVLNESDINSATHTAPFLGGYSHRWDDEIGNWLNAQFQTGPGSQKTQTITWTETIDLRNPKPPTGPPASGWAGWGGSDAGSGGGGSSGGGGDSGGGFHGRVHFI